MNSLKYTALIIWWCEGTKQRKDKRWKNSYTNPVEVTNSDPKIINIFLAFLRKGFNIEETKFHVQLQIHENDNKQLIEKYWSEILKIPLIQFDKTIIRPIGNKPGKNRGTCKIRVYNKILYIKLKQMLDKYLEQIELI